jgi:S-DNA-T family DNA segregation ATPase FtsK/SpoIIIE
VLRHERVGTGRQHLVRHAMYLVGGTRIVARRAWDGRTAARYERMIRACEAACKHEESKEWEERGRQFRAARHQRRMDVLTAPQQLVRSAVAGVAGGVAGLLALGGVLAVARGDPAEILAPASAMMDLISWVAVIAAVVWGPVKAAVPVLCLLGLWAVGRHQRTAPQWALPVSERDDGAPITPSIVVTALRDLGVAALRKAIQEMGDAGAAMLSPIRIAGCGVEVDATLSSGASTEEVMNRRRKLAENLGRHEHEVFLSVAPAARTVRMWIADSGALDEPVPASPLVTDPDISADYRSGRAPWGQDLRGDAALIGLYQMHLLITGLSNQGKTASLRALALWLATDPSVEFRIGDLKGVGDWSMFDGLATVLIEGPTDDHVVQVTEMVESAFREMQRRILAPKGTVFAPLIVIVDEAQVAYGSGAIGPDKRPFGGSKVTSRYFQAVKGIHDQGRVVNVVFWEGTQDPTNENLPKRSREGNHIRAALVLGTEEQAKMALGAKAIDGGAAPHKLRQGIDKGVIVVAGDGVALAPGQSSLTIRTHYINDDEADGIAERAKARRRATTTRTATESPEQTDPLADILTALGDVPRLRTQEVLQRLTERNPGAYRPWTFADLRHFLSGYSAEPYKSEGQMVVSRSRVLEALEERAREAEEHARD